jgi:multiple antibiotic resistance protein
MEQFWHAFIPLFVALDGIGLLPVFWGLTQSLDRAERARAVREAVVTAFVVALGFLLLSGVIFTLMGLQLADVMMAGGAILLVLSLRDLLLSEDAPSGKSRTPGVVPLGVPLLTGPAVLTTVLLVRDRHGWVVTLSVLLINLVFVWLILHASGWLLRRLGREGAQVISKIASVVLSAYGIMLIRHGVTLMLRLPGTR